MLEILVIDLPTHERLEHIDLPEAQRLSKVAMWPGDSLPDVSHGNSTGAQLVVVVHQMKVLAIECVNTCLHRLECMPDALPGHVGGVPLFLLRLTFKQVARCGDEEHRQRAAPYSSP
eukprot:7380355-Prymnesium_polylepis.1